MGVEIECSVLEGIAGAPPDTSMPGQLLIDGGEEFWDFEAEYLDRPAGWRSPRRSPPMPARRSGGSAAEAFDAVSCEGLRQGGLFLHDRRADRDQRDRRDPRPVPASYFQKMWEASGLPSRQLIDRLLQTALAKRPGLR